jgi:hypothetical protein
MQTTMDNETLFNIYNIFIRISIILVVAIFLWAIKDTVLIFGRKFNKDQQSKEDNIINYAEQENMINYHKDHKYYRNMVFVALITSLLALFSSVFEVFIQTNISEQYHFTNGNHKVTTTTVVNIEKGLNKEVQETLSEIENLKKEYHYQKENLSKASDWQFLRTAQERENQIKEIDNNMKKIEKEINLKQKRLIEIQQLK